MKGTICSGNNLSSEAGALMFEQGGNAFDALLQLESGIKKTVANELKKKYKVNLWKDKNMFFGGVHTATIDGGAGDKRREGALNVV